jgi:hypothetical protein
MVKSFITLAQGGKLRFYCVIFNLENVGTAVNYRGSFIRLAPGFKPGEVRGNPQNIMNTL